MSAGRLRTMLLPALLLLSTVATAVEAADMEEFLPPVTCGSGWQMAGKAVFYDRLTLSERINGEAELYLPYGFERMAAARYIPLKDAGSGMDVEIYRMGSRLDAFGIYGNYRRKEGRTLPFGAGSNLSGTQLYLYQGHYFVHIQITGSSSPDPAALVACGTAVTSRLPDTTDTPPELAPFERPEIVKGSQRYLPQNLLGYDFLNRGIMADAVVDGAALQLFLLVDTTAESASSAFDGYRSQLPRGTVHFPGNGAAILEGIDPLYGPVTVLKKGSCLAGALKSVGTTTIRALLESLCR